MARLARSTSGMTATLTGFAHFNLKEINPLPGFGNFFSIQIVLSKSAGRSIEDVLLFCKIDFPCSEIQPSHCFFVCISLGSAMFKRVVF